MPEVQGGKLKVTISFKMAPFSKHTVHLFILKTRSTGNTIKKS
jgi:hypothetical protein